MRDAYQVARVREAEAALMALVPDGALMQRAAAGLASVCAGILRDGNGGVYGARVAVLAGPGDNGGDALFAGARLAARGAEVTAIAAAGDRVHRAGAQALKDAGGRVIDVTPPRGPDDTAPDIPGRYDAGHDVRSAIGRADVILDGLLGIGGKGGLRAPFGTLAQLAANSKGLTVAVDLPSGIDADTGRVDGPAVRADVTVTFGALKPGLLIDPAASHAGVVEFIDIGLAPYLSGTPDVRAPQHDDILRMLPTPGAESDKYRRGVLGLLAGSDRFTGAALLATGGAVHGGAGMVRLVTGRGAAVGVRREWPEVVVTELPPEANAEADPGAARPQTPDEARDTDATGRSDDRTARGDDPPYPPTARPMADEARLSAAHWLENVGRVQAWCAGPGMGTDAGAAARLAAVLRTNLPVLVDADGLTILSQNEHLLPRSAPTLLTPHAGELGRLLGADPANVAARRAEHARAAARRYGATVLLKGSTTVIAPPDSIDPVLVNTTGTPFLATAGTGDVLSGLTGALLAQGMLPPQAAIAGAYLHGLAARVAARADAPIGASDVVRALQSAFRALHQ